VAKVDRDALFVSGLNHRPQRTLVSHHAPVAQRIARSRRLDLDDASAHVAEQARAIRTGDQRSEFEYAKAVKLA